MRRLVDAGTLPVLHDAAGRKVVKGADLAAYVSAQAAGHREPNKSSARNRFRGLVTHVTTDTVMAQVEMQCGSYRVTSLMSADSVRDLGLEVGTVAWAVIKSTAVIVETR